jgi:hypothetical protein
MADAGEPPPEVETAPMPPPRRDGLYVVTVGLLVGLGLAVPVGVVAFLRRRVRP